MYVCMYVRMYVCMYVCVCMSVCMHSCMHACIYVHLQTSVCIYIYVYICRCMCIYMYVRVDLSLYIYIYICGFIIYSCVNKALGLLLLSSLEFGSILNPASPIWNPRRRGHVEFARQGCAATLNPTPLNHKPYTPTPLNPKTLNPKPYTPTPLNPKTLNPHPLLAIRRWNTNHLPPTANLKGISNPDPREDLESRSPNLGPYTTKGTLQEPPLRDLLFGSSRGSGKGLRNLKPLNRTLNQHPNRQT